MKNDKDSSKPKSNVSMTKTIERGGDSQIKNDGFNYGYKEIKDEMEIPFLNQGISDGFT